MESGKKGAKEHVRAIKLLDSGVNVTIKIAEWLKASADAFVKEFDETNTRILRVWRHRHGAGFMVYGMNNVEGTVTEAYEVVALEGMVADAVDKIAAHCGLGADFRNQVKV